MQTISLIIPGSYYDSQIYKGYLYLWSSKGSIITIDWGKLIESIPLPNELQHVFTCAFQKSNFFYDDPSRFQNMEAIQCQFQKLMEKSPIDISQNKLQKFFIREQANPFAFPHADSTIYNDVLYVGSRSGLFKSICEKKTEFPINDPKEIWDGPALSLSALYSTLSISAGNEGLFRRSVFKDNTKQEEYHEPRQLIDHHSNFTRWLYAGVFSSSYFNEGYLANFKKSGKDEPKTEPVFLGIEPSSKIFGHETKNGVSSWTWGSHDKICFATPEVIEVVKYNPYNNNQKFASLGKVPIEKIMGDIISGDSAMFGFVIEHEDGLLVINSLVESLWLPGEPVNWRVFPKSTFYTNQLHVIYDDHLCIHSFNDDYFVDQNTKQIGIEYFKPKSSS